ncbi:MAG: DUF3488 and transglutaminase-like domain-containing protein [Aquihabitans sp.]
MTLLVSELALLLVHLAVVAGFGRVYVDGSFAPTLVTFVVVAHLLAAGGRRLPVPVWALTMVAVGGAVLLSTWLLFADTTAFGLPTGATWDAVQDATTVGRGRFREVVAPAPVLTGFQLWAGLALWGAVWFADWAAFRLRTTAEAVVPGVVIFVFCAIFGSGQHRTLSAAVLAATVLLFVAAHRAFRTQSTQAWLTSSAALGPRSVLRVGAVMTVAAVAAGVLISPLLPGSGSEATLRWRSSESGTGSRTTVSPIVDLQKRLVEQSDAVFFTVQSDAPAYWRLTGLDHFDGRIWRIDGEFGLAAGSLGSTSPDAPVDRVITQTFEIRALDDIWVPAAFEAQQIDESNGKLRWDPASSTLISDADSADGLVYTVASVTPEHPREVLLAADGPDPTALERFRTLPVDFPEQARSDARLVTAGLATRYEQALALQSWFRDDFEYSLDVAPGHDDDALVAFLASRRGYCEQFAGAYASMARSLGIPARVAVGFTPGDESPEAPGTYVVRGRHAHAWPEVWFDGIGWVPFEPTPGRGMPGAEEHTGVAAAQDEQRSTTPTTQPTATTVPGSPTSEVTTPTTPPTTQPATAPPVTGSGDGTGSGPGESWWWLLAVSVLGLAVWLGVVLVVPLWRQRRRRGVGVAGRVLTAWDEALIAARWLTGLRPQTSDTHLEFAATTGLPDLVALAELATLASWSAEDLSPTQADQAEALGVALTAQARTHGSRFARLRHRLSWREAFQSSVSSPS